jgi:ribulose-5-phosphate 4-epimerase/fuculose-1-phosphate aldolase
MSDNDELIRRLAPRPGRHPLLPDLSPQAELALLCRVLFREGYDDHIAGHITWLQPDGSLLVNPWELAWDELTAGDILRVDDTGKVVEGDWNVTPAINLHLEVHAARADVGIIIHNHSRWGTLWANAKRVPAIYDQTSAQVDGDIAIYDEYSGTVEDEQEARTAVAALGDHKWALLANHGVFVVAKDLRQAHLRAITLEWRCRQAWHMEALGGGEPLPDPVADKVGAMIDGNGFPFLWEAMARRELRRDPSVVND